MQPTLFDTALEKPRDPYAHVPQDCRETFLTFKRLYQDEPVPRAIYGAWAAGARVEKPSEQLAKLIEAGCVVETTDGLRFV